MTRLPPLLLAAAVSACMPWALGQTAETLAPGEVQGGIAVSALGPPTELDVLPVPQAWAAAGLLDGLDVTAAYALPLTAEARVRGRVLRWSGWTAALSAGLGVHGIPDVAGAGEIIWTPYVPVTVHASGPLDGRAYGALRVFAPFATQAEPAVTFWIAPLAGLELHWRWLRWGPELGAVVPTTHPGDFLLSLALWARWDGALP